MNVEEVMSISRTHINVGDYVYFEAGSHNYPLGLVENIQSVGGEKQYTVKHGDASYFVTQKQIYKTDEKKNQLYHPNLTIFILISNFLF